MVIENLKFLFVSVAHAAITIPRIADGQDFGDFVRNLYNLAIALVGFAVFIQFLRAGLTYLLAAGGSGEISKAKEMMQNAIIGAILLLSAYLILNVINPDLVKTDLFETNLEEKLGSSPAP